MAYINGKEIWFSPQINISTATPNLQDVSVTPGTLAQTIMADEGYDGLGTVTIEEIPTEIKTVDLQFDFNDYQYINSSVGIYMTRVVVKKPATFIASNIKKGVNIAGITGSFSDEESIYNELLSESYPIS